MKRFLAFILVAAMLFLPRLAAAHVLVTDDTKQSGAVLHVSPDDNPIAGEPSSLFIDTQSDQVSHATHAFKLTITDAAGHRTIVPIMADKNTVSATYTFPTQGTHTLELSAEAVSEGGQAWRFEHTQQVSRGVATPNPPARSLPSWAVLGLGAGLGLLLAVMVLAWKKRKTDSLR